VSEKKISPAYRLIKALVRLFYGKTAVVGAEHLPDGPCIVVGNHCQMNSPIACELDFPGRHATWCAGEMMHLKEVPAYAFRDFWSAKPKAVRWLFRIASYLIAPLSVCVFNNADCIGVYRDTRIISTFRETVEALQDGRRVIIFPEHDPPVNNILSAFQDRFVTVAKQYHRRTGTALSFVPLYMAPALRTMYLGEPVRYDPDAPQREECRRVCDALSARIAAMATALPRHRVVPYRNIPRKDYPYNIPFEVYPHDEADG
jgi:hypothetical protein